MFTIDQPPATNQSYTITFFKSFVILFMLRRMTALSYTFVPLVKPRLRLGTSFFFYRSVPLKICNIDSHHNHRHLSDLSSAI